MIKNTNKKTTLEEVRAIVESVSDNSASKKEVPHLKEINYCFKNDSVINIVKRLEEVSQGKVNGMDSEFGSKTLQTFSKLSPLSMAVVFEAIV